MTYLTTMDSPVGPLLLASDGTSLTGLWLEHQKYFAAGLDPAAQKAPALPVFRETERWLRDYFAGRLPPALPLLAPVGTVFRQSVWRRLLEIPYGQTCTYGLWRRSWVPLPERWGARLGTIPSPFSSPATGSWVQTAV